MPKTGSSTIQNTLSKCKNNNWSILYPNFGGIHHAHLLNRAFNTTISPINKDHKKKLHAKLLDFFNTNDWGKHDTVILSSETLPLVLNHEDLSGLRIFLSEHAEEVIVIGYIRPPKSYIESAFQQTLKFAISYPNVRDIVIGQRYPFYTRLFKKFYDVFGEKNVTLWKFDPASFQNRCVATDFLYRLGITLPRNQIVTSNEGLSLEAVSFLYAYLRYGIKRKFIPRQGAAFINELSKYNSERKLKFSSKIIYPILHKNKADIDWIQNRIGISLEEDIYKDDTVAINRKHDLLQFSPEALSWLEKKIFCETCAQNNHSNMSVQEVVRWLDLMLDNSGV